MQTPDPSPPPAISILVADDEPQLLRLIERVLERSGHRVLTAPDGAAAVEQLRVGADSLRVLVLDAAILPEGAGPIVDAAAKAGAAPGLVLMSGDALEPGLHERMLEHDGVFLRKPFRPDALLRAVEDSLVREVD